MTSVFKNMTSIAHFKEKGKKNGKEYDWRVAGNAFCKSIYYVGTDHSNAFIFVCVPGAKERDGGKDTGNYPGGGGCDRSIYRGTLLGKKIGKTKIFVGIDLRNFVFSCLSVAFLFDQRSNAHHTGGDQILCGDGTGRNDWRNGELVHK